ncbi:chaperonin 10-like protein [Lipomyces doorenjongii]
MVSATAMIVPKLGAAFEARTVELDSLRPHEVLVDIKATGICHTDIAVQQGKIPIKFPAVLGHEGSGVVRAVGSAVRDFEVDDHVILSYNFCNTCRSCKSRQTYQCQTAQKQNFGGMRPDGSQTIVTASEPISTCFFGQSSFCNPTVVQEASCVKIDKSLPLSVVCALGCGFQTGAGSVYNVVKPLERKVRHIAIFGVGGVGCAAIMAAHHLANSDPTSSFDIIAVDVNDSRLELAQALGATHIINPNQKTVRDDVMEITGGEGVDATVDCTASLTVINEMIGLVGVGGIAVTVGGPAPGTKASVDVFDMLIKCKTYCGCHQGNAYSKTFIPWLTELYAQGQFPLEKMQKTYAARDINAACKDMLSGIVLKPVLLWD